MKTWTEVAKDMVVPIFAILFLTMYLSANAMMQWWIDGSEGLPFAASNEFGYGSFGLIYASLKLTPVSPTSVVKKPETQPK